MTITIATIGWSLWITGIIAYFVRKWRRANGKQIGPLANWGGLAVLIAAVICIVVGLIS
jgi:hypothetical protein